MGDPDQGAPSAPTPSFSELRTYFHHTRHDAIEELVSVVNSRYATPSVVDDALATATALDPERNRRIVVERAAAASPHPSIDQLMDWWEDPLLRFTVAANPALGADGVTQLWERTGHLGLLANPHIDTEVLRGNVADHQELIVKNPAAPPDVLEICAKTYSGTAHANPGCPPEMLWAMIDKADSASIWALSNPTLTLAELHDLRDEQLARAANGLRSWTLGALERAIDLRILTTDPHSVLTLAKDRHVDPMIVMAFEPLDVIDPLMECLTAGGEPADAAASLLANGFTGTVGELLGVAGAITAP